MPLQTVLVIDDDAVSVTADRQALEEDFHVIFADTGHEGIRIAREQKPDIILLDIEMPGMSGYQACEILKCETATHDTPIVFVSSCNNVRDRMLGYEMGAEEFIPKPYHPGELRHKIKRLSQRILAHIDLSERADMATRTAMTVMAGNSELGVAMQFVESSYGLASVAELAVRLLRALDTFYLNSAVMFLTSDGPRFFCSRGESKPMEEELMLAIHAQSMRIHDFGCRTQINYPRVALLVKNMPLQDRDRYGRLKDLFPVMLGAADARLRSLETENALLSQTQDLARSFRIVESTLKEQSASLRMTQTQVARVVRTLWKEFEIKLPTLGLDDDQEHFLMVHVEQALQETEDAMAHSDMLQGSFDSVMRLLKHLTERQQKIVDDFMSKPPALDTVFEASDTGAEIELF